MSWRRKMAGKKSGKKPKTESDAVKTKKPGQGKATDKDKKPTEAKEQEEVRPKG
jgi:hypothetical protein